jgi:4-hydroxy-tetrahydrodipicolinate reductase
MKIALIGYGKMGKAIENIALQKGHEIVLKIDYNNASEMTPDNLQKADVAIEFTGPESAADNIKRCIEAGVPVVSGSTGWLARWQEVSEVCLEKDSAMVYASNYSIGVNLFFEVNKFLAKMMNEYSQYDVKVSEVHHTQKLDSPSGTAITLAEQVLEHIKRKSVWVNQHSPSDDKLEITSLRQDPAPGTHTVKYTSNIDDIEIIHTAHNRVGFASGAIVAAEFINGKKGVFTMKDVLGL